MWQKPTHKSSFKESIEVLEADIQHANNLVPALPRDLGGDSVRMKLSYSAIAPFVLFLIEWMNYSCLDTMVSCLGLLHIHVYRVYVDGMPTMSAQERKATLWDFYDVIYPSLKQLEGNLMELMQKNLQRTKYSDGSGGAGGEQIRDACECKDPETEECEICMELDSKVVLPKCGHSMCIGCFHDWCVRSQTCPFCRSSLKGVSSKDLWVLTRSSEVVDSITLATENIGYFYRYIETLPLMVPDYNLLMYDLYAVSW